MKKLIQKYQKVINIFSYVISILFLISLFSMWFYYGDVSEHNNKIVDLYNSVSATRPDYAYEYTSFLRYDNYFTPGSKNSCDFMVGIIYRTDESFDKVQSDYKNLKVAPVYSSHSLVDLKMSVIDVGQRDEPVIVPIKDKDEYDPIDTLIIPKGYLQVTSDKTFYLVQAFDTGYDPGRDPKCNWDLLPPRFLENFFIHI